MEVDILYRREKIILNAIELINENGSYSVSTKEIAKRIGVSEGTIFRYFPKKSDLMAAVLEEFSQYDEDVFLSAKSKTAGSVESIIFYIESYITYYENYPAITAILLGYESLSRMPGIEEKTREIFFNRIKHMGELINLSQNSGALSKSIDCDSLATIILSTLGGVCLQWRMSNFSFSLREKTMTGIKELIKVFSKTE